MKTTRCIRILVGALWVGAVGCGSGEAQRAPAREFRPPAFQAFDNGAIAMQVPAGWRMALAGDCTTLAFALQDPAEPLRKVLSFGLVGPVYQSQMQKQIDYQSMGMGAPPIEWFDMPVVDPLNPGNFLANFAQIAASQIAQRFMPGCPRLEGFQMVSSMPIRCPLNAPGAQTAMVRGVFVEDGRVAEGLFTLTTAPFMPSMGGPGGGTAYGYMLAGITAPEGELEAWRSTLLKPLESFSIHPQYVQGCLMRSQAAFGSVMRAGQTLRETSGLIAQSWESRNRTDDIMAAKRSDAILGRERLYDPGTGEVFEFNNGFHDQYRLNPAGYPNGNLQPLPEGDHGLWTAPARDGYRELGL